MTTTAIRVCAGCGDPLPPRKPHDYRRKWCSERCRKAQYAGTCADCGAPTNGSDGRGVNAAKVCSDCCTERFVTRNAERTDAHRALIERMWAEGKTWREIAVVVGWTGEYSKTNISKYRAGGYNLPHRRPKMAELGKVHGRESLVLARATVGRKERVA